MKVLAISGSLRAASSNAALIRAATRVAPPGMEIAVYGGVGSLPHFTPDLDVDPLPAAVADLRARIASVDGMIICSPEYAHGVPGSLKNALDWLVSSLEAPGKPTLLVSAAPSGAVYAHAQLIEILQTMSLALVDGGAHVLPRTKLDASGEIADADLLVVLRRSLDALATVIRAAAPRADS